MNYNFLKKIFIGTLIFVIQTSYVGAKTIDQSINDAINNSKELKAREYYLKSAKSYQYEGYIEFLPEVSASVQYGEKKNNRLENDDRFQDEENRTLTLSQPLFQGFGGVQKLKQGKNTYLSSLNSYNNFKQELVIKAISNFLNLHKARKKVEISKENKEFHEKILEQIKLRKNLISESEKINYEINFANSISSLEESESELEQAISDYKILTGKIDENLNLPEIDEKDFEDNHDSYNLSSKHPAVKEKYHSYIASKANSKISISEFSPTANLVLTRRDQKDVVYLGGDDLEEKSIYLDVTIPIFQKGLEYSNLSKTRNEERAKKYEYEHVRDEISEEISRSLREYKSKKQIFKSKKRILALTENQYQKQKTNFDYGKVDLIGFYQSKIKYNESLLESLEARVNMQILYYKIKLLIGQMKI